MTILVWFVEFIPRWRKNTSDSISFMGIYRHFPAIPLTFDGITWWLAAFCGNNGTLIAHYWHIIGTYKKKNENPWQNGHCTHLVLFIIFICWLLFNYLLSSNYLLVPCFQRYQQHDRNVGIVVGIHFFKNKIVFAAFRACFLAVGNIGRWWRF